MPEFKIEVNGLIHTIEVDGNMPLLWVLRDELGLLGTKYGCGIGSCGACTVLLDHQAVQSCSIRIKDVEGQITTIEGAQGNSIMSLVIEAWVDHQVAQCGYCQPGQIIRSTSLLMENPNLSEEIIDQGLASNICRCGTYPRIKTALIQAGQRLTEGNHGNSEG